MNDASQRLTRSNKERMVLGVCGGIAERLDLDPTLVRLAFVVFFFAGPGLLAYLIGALVIPKAPALPPSVRIRPLPYEGARPPSASPAYATPGDRAMARVPSGGAAVRRY